MQVQVFPPEVTFRCGDPWSRPLPDRHSDQERVDTRALLVKALATPRPQSSSSTVTVRAQAPPSAETALEVAFQADASVDYEDESRGDEDRDPAVPLRAYKACPCLAGSGGPSVDLGTSQNRDAPVSREGSATTAHLAFHVQGFSDESIFEPEGRRAPSWQERRAQGPVRSRSPSESSPLRWR